MCVWGRRVGQGVCLMPTLTYYFQICHTFFFSYLLHFVHFLDPPPQLCFFFIPPFLLYCFHSRPPFSFHTCHPQLFFFHIQKPVLMCTILVVLKLRRVFTNKRNKVFNCCLLVQYSFRTILLFEVIFPCVSCLVGKQFLSYW